MVMRQQSLSTLSKRTGSFPPPANYSQPAPMGYQSRHLATCFPKQSICPFRGNGANVRLYHSYVQNDLGISIYSNNWCRVLFIFKARGRNCERKSIQILTWVLVTAITKTKSPSEGAEVAVTSLRGWLLIFCWVWTCLLALQVLELIFRLKNPHAQRHSRDTLKHLAAV